jgi:hypothetical protein
MENNKYYIPEIEEFHVGFEYEQIPSIGYRILNLNKPEEQCETHCATEYEKGIFGIKPVAMFGGELANIESAIKDKKCRVKYLDQKDIESFGFECTEEVVKDKFYKSHFCKFKKQQTEITIQFENVNNKYPNPCNFKGTNFHFSIIIKNKAELKKLLKQLGIYEREEG